jgi:hypothetical protein
MSRSKLHFFFAAAALVGGCARPFVQGVDLAGTGPGEDLSTSEPHDLAGRDFSSNIPCDLGAGWKVCNNMCLAPTACCTGNDCPSPPTGQALCMNGVCVVGCNAGYRACGTNCIPNSACCTAADCNSGPHVTATSCNTVTGMCKIGSCLNGYYDIDGQFQNGCECADQNKGKSCQTATAIGALPTGAMLSSTGNLPAAGLENWFSVSFTGTTQASNPKVVLSTNPGNQFKIDVFSDCNKGMSAACSEPGQSSVGVTTFEMKNTMGDPNGNGTGTPPWSSAQGTFYVRVSRVAGSNPTCDTYGLTWSD